MPPLCLTIYSSAELRRKGGLRTVGFPGERQLFRLGFHLGCFQDDPPKKEQFNIVNYFPWLHNVIHLFGSSKYLRHRGSKANG